MRICDNCNSLFTQGYMVYNKVACSDDCLKTLGNFECFEDYEKANKELCIKYGEEQDILCWNHWEDEDAEDDEHYYYLKIKEVLNMMKDFNKDTDEGAWVQTDGYCPQFLIGYKMYNHGIYLQYDAEDKEHVKKIDYNDVEENTEEEIEFIKKALKKSYTKMDIISILNSLDFG